MTVEPFVLNTRVLLELSASEACVVRDMLKRDAFVDKAVVMDVIAQIRAARAVKERDDAGS